MAVGGDNDTTQPLSAIFAPFVEIERVAIGGCITTKTGVIKPLRGPQGKPRVHELDISSTTLLPGGLAYLLEIGLLANLTCLSIRLQFSARAELSSQTLRQLLQAVGGTIRELYMKLVLRYEDDLIGTNLCTWYMPASHPQSSI